MDTFNNEFNNRFKLKRNTFWYLMVGRYFGPKVYIFFNLTLNEQKNTSK